jgi:hypothetical protein
MATTETSIVNDALSLLGAERIISLDDDSPVARLFNEQFDKTRDALLEAHPWRFAMGRASLALSTSAPAYGFTYYYVLPADCLRIVETEYEDVAWEREGQFLATDESSMAIRYIKKITQPGLFSYNFAKTLAAKLAYENSYAVVPSLELKEKLKENYILTLSESRSFSAQEASPRVPYAKQWLNSRY